MNEIYVNSDNVEVFPSHRRSRILNKPLATERDILRILFQLIDVESFVITKVYIDGYILEFNVGGYYFCINDMNPILQKLNGSCDIYANIKIIDSQLIGQDSEDKYTGLFFTSSKPNQENIYSLKILTRKSLHSNWYIPKESKVKFGTSSIGVDD